MKYQNKVTGMTVESGCMLTGDLWEPVRSQIKASAAKPAKKVKKGSKKK